MKKKQLKKQLHKAMLDLAISKLETVRERRHNARLSKANIELAQIMQISEVLVRKLQKHEAHKDEVKDLDISIMAFKEQYEK